MSQGFSGLPAAAVCTGKFRNFGVFSGQIWISGNSGKCPDGFPYDEFFPGEIRGFQFFRGFTAVATYKICKISRFWVFSGTDFPDFRKFRIPEIRDTFCAFREFQGFRESRPEKTLFSETALRSRVLRGFRMGFRGFQEISGTLSKNFGKFRNRKFQI
jgi:hypothetical protein